jgi:hypothetical protein
MENKKCPKCGGEMDEGLQTNKMNNFIHVMNLPLVWGRKLVKSYISGYKLEDEKEIKTYRCTKCGYLESYAS